MHSSGDLWRAAPLESGIKRQYLEIGRLLYGTLKYVYILHATFKRLHIKYLSTFHF